MRQPKFVEMKAGEMPVRPLGDRRSPDRRNPRRADDAQLIGDVVLGSGVSVWFNAVLRGDTERISVGAGSNVGMGRFFTPIPDFLHGRNRRRDRPRRHPPRLPDWRRLPDWDGRDRPQGAKIGPGSIVAAGAVVPEGKEFPPRSLIMGVPAKVVREATTQDLEQIAAGARHYQERARLYQAELGEESCQPLIRTPCELSLRRSSALVGGPRRLLPARSRAGSRRYVAELRWKAVHVTRRLAELNRQPQQRHRPKYRVRPFDHHFAVPRWGWSSAPSMA